MHGLFTYGFVMAYLFLLFWKHLQHRTWSIWKIRYHHSVTWNLEQINLSWPCTQIPPREPAHPHVHCWWNKVDIGPHWGWRVGTRANPRRMDDDRPSNWKARPSQAAVVASVTQQRLEMWGSRGALRGSGDAGWQWDRMEKIDVQRDPPLRKALKLFPETQTFKE